MKWYPEKKEDDGWRLGFCWTPAKANLCKDCGGRMWLEWAYYRVGFLILGKILCRSCYVARLLRQ